MNRPAHANAGFTLTELAIVMAIVGLLMGSLMYTLSAQSEQRSFEETRRRLELARELLLAFAVVNGRLPCPATLSPSTAGSESIALAAGTGSGGTCGGYYNGYLPAVSIGFAPSSADGFAIDAWGNRIRYAVSQTNAPQFTGSVALRAGWSSTPPADIDICRSLAALNQAGCGAAANRVATLGTVVAVVWSQGKNFAVSGAAGLDEANNNDAFAAFVSRVPSPAGSPLGEFDDLLEWIPVGVLYTRLIAAGALP
jgi:prepilin-type N-terminal cleavage/methylation domain-containing protein